MVMKYEVIILADNFLRDNLFSEVTEKVKIPH